MIRNTIFSCDLLKIEKYPQGSKQRYQRQSMTNQNQIVEIKCCLKKEKKKVIYTKYTIQYEQEKKIALPVKS